MSLQPIVIIAAALLRVGSRRLRALARGDDGALREWIASESAVRLAEARRDAARMVKRLESLAARLYTIEDSAFPEAFRELRDPPPFLIVRGTLDPAPRGGRGTAIIGSRQPITAALRFAGELAASAPPPTVSGLARGIDAAAHRGAIANGRSTVAYVGHGFGATHPPEHQHLEDEIVRHGGAVVTERLPDEAVSNWSLVRRDRLQAAHARAVVLIQSEPDGGAMHTMRFAAQLGRRRLALAPPGEGFGGNHAALAGGARTIDWDAATALETLSAIGREEFAE